MKSFLSLLFASLVLFSLNASERSVNTEIKPEVYTAQQHCNDLKGALLKLKSESESPINSIIDSLTQSLDATLARGDDVTFLSNAILEINKAFEEHRSLIPAEKIHSFGALLMPIALKVAKFELKEQYPDLNNSFPNTIPTRPTASKFEQTRIDMQQEINRAIARPMRSI
jgi:hypothetical protein